MKKVTDEQKYRFSLTLLFTLTVLIFLIITSVIAGLVIFSMVYRGQLKLNESELNIGKFIFTLFFWSTVIGFIMTMIASRYPLKPVNKFLNMINSLAVGNYSVRLHFKEPLAHFPVIREMTESVNILASELEQTEILRKDFINNFSHEFKTPIVSIAGFAKMLKRGELSAEEQREYLDIIEEESLRLAQLSSNILNLTKVESRTILTDIEKYNLSEQIRTCVLMLEKKWTKKNIEMRLPEEEFEIYGNVELLKEVWINLLDNAIKFSNDYGIIDIRIRQIDGITEIGISNFCDDIPEDKLLKIYNKFYQADESHSKEGNGVGLAIVKKVAELHNGSVKAISQNGKTTFYVSLPDLKKHTQ